MSEQQGIPVDFKKLVIASYRSIKEQHKPHIHSNYDAILNKLPEKWEWPEIEKINHFIENDPLFTYLYKELYYRHMYSVFPLLVNIEQRMASWENYSAFFDFLLGQKKPLALSLPLQWIWDIIDEFLYQYQEFCQYRSKVSDKSPSEIQILKDSPQIWNTVSVLKFFHRFMELSDIVKTLEREKGGGTSDPSNLFAGHPTYSYFGYFSIIALCRMHCIMGDYYLALKTLDPIEFYTKKSRYSRVTTAFITLYYYAGFVYMMLRRYQDAIKTFTHILLYISRINQSSTRQYDQKKNDQMYALLAILLHFCPRRIDEHISNILKQEHSDKLLTMQSKEIEDIRGSENFSYGSPKFVSPAVPNYDEEPTSSATLLQKKLFTKEISQSAPLPVIESYLKLYTTIHTNNLAHLLDQKHDKDTLRMFLLRFVHKNRQLQWSTGMPTSKGSWCPATIVEFYIEGDMIHVIDKKVNKNYSDIFIRHCAILEEIRTDLEKQTQNK